jgi:hypothetical protein
MSRVRQLRTTLPAACVALLVSACGGTSVSPVAPTAATPVAPAPSFPVVRLTGQVTDVARRPLAAHVGVFPLRISQTWYGAWGRGSESDGSGRYQITNAPEHPDTAYVRAWKDGYVQQCAAAVTLAGDTSADLTLTPIADVAIAGLPAILAARQMSGTVYTSREGQRQPLAGAWVGWEMDMDTVVADTVTDSQGRYRLCGMPKDHIYGLYAARVGTGAPVYAEVAAGGDAVVDFDLP